MGFDWNPIATVGAALGSSLISSAIVLRVSANARQDALDADAEDRREERLLERNHRLRAALIELELADSILAEPGIGNAAAAAPDAAIRAAMADLAALRPDTREAVVKAAAELARYNSISGHVDHSNNTRSAAEKDARDRVRPALSQAVLLMRSEPFALPDTTN